VFRVVTCDTFTDLVGVPTESLHFPLDQKPCVNTDPSQIQKLWM
jgi:hypothetical protein